MKRPFSFSFFILIFLVACSTEPQPINYGKDLCAYCSMTIMDKKFGAELINSKGKAVKFDSGECMLKYLNESNDFKPEKFLVVDYLSEGKLINAEQAFYLHGGKLNSPMGGGLAAFKSKPEAESIQAELGAEILNWQELKKTEW